MPALTIGRALRRFRAGRAHSIWLAPAFSAPETIMLSSPDFADGCTMPQPHAGIGVGQNLSPALEWTAPPAGTAQLLLILEDADVPMPRPLIHTVAVFPAKLRAVTRGDLRPENPSVQFLKATFGKTGYLGPTPPKGHGPHHYEFSIYSLDQALPADARSIGAVHTSIAGHVTARGRLTGIYER